MRLAAIAAVAALAGCAAPAPQLTIDQIRARAPGASDYQICRTTMMAPAGDAWNVVAQEEQRRRSLDCAPYAQAVIAEEAARRQNALQAYQIMQAAQPAYQPYQVQPLPAPPQPARQVNCTSQRIGNQVQTNCY